jgi:hypothetical protein
VAAVVAYVVAVVVVVSYVVVVVVLVVVWRVVVSWSEGRVCGRAEQVARGDEGGVGRERVGGVEGEKVGVGLAGVVCIGCCSHVPALPGTIYVF